MAAPLLTVDGLSVSYPGRGGRFLAADEVSFDLAAGETFGLVGESGSGKTTTAMAILRLLRPPARIERGRILLGDADVLSLPDREIRRLRWSKLALIPQGAMNSLNPVMRIEDQIADAILTHEGRGARRRLGDRLVDLLATVGLPARVRRMYPHELSGGMKQRVCIAMAIALQPQVIVADEPTSALDVVVQRVVAQTLLEVQERIGAAVILIGHDMGLQAQMVQRLAVMYRGRIVELGPVRELFNDPVHPYTRLLIASIPSIRERRAETHDQRALARAVGARAGCVLGADCPGPGDGRPTMHEVAPGHLVACEAEERGRSVRAAVA
jgi:oligopeptide/dipeptide ABC transporter ATP-binding protein